MAEVKTKNLYHQSIIQICLMLKILICHNACKVKTLRLFKDLLSLCAYDLVTYNVKFITALGSVVTILLRVYK